MGGGAPIDGGTTKAGRVLSDMRRHPDPPKFDTHSSGVVVLVGTDSYVRQGWQLTSFGGISFPGAHCLGDAAVDVQGMAGVHEHMAPAARLVRVCIGLAG